MSTTVISGKIVSEHRRMKLKERVQSCLQKFGRTPCLAVVIVGDNKASHVYVRNKEKACADLGIRSIRIDLSANCSQLELNGQIAKLVYDQSVDGILVQLPLPPQLSDKIVAQMIPGEKDADGFTYLSLGQLMGDVSKVAPCTPAGVMALLEYYKVPIEGKHAVVVGRSLIVGKPMAQLLTRANATVTVCHSRSGDIRRFTRDADIVVVAAGKREFMGREDFKQGAVVIDVGIHGTGDGKSITGDVRYKELEGWASAATPVPGGVGPMTITMLLENTIELMEQRLSARGSNS